MTGEVGDCRLHQWPHPVPANRARRIAVTCRDDRRRLPRRQVGDRARLAAVAWQVLEQVSDDQQPQ